MRQRRETAARERSLQCSTTLKIFSRSPNCTFFIKGYPFQLLNCKGWRWVCRHWRRSRAGSYKSTYFWCTQNTTQDSGLNPSWKHGWCKNRSLNWVIVPVQARVRKCAETWKEMQLHKYGRKIWEILVTVPVIWTCKREVGQVANARWDKTGSCRATNEGEWVTPTSVACPCVHYSKKHPFIVISIEKNWVIWLQSKIPSSWGVRSPDWLSSQSGNQTTNGQIHCFCKGNQLRGAKNLEN